MSHIEILAPFSLPPAELAKDLLRELKLPALSMLLSRATRMAPAITAKNTLADGFERALPHEAWLARRFGMGAALAAGGSVPIASALMHVLGITPEPGHWFIAQPVHFHIARDHLVLTDPRQLTLSDADSRALFQTALVSFAEAGLTLCYGSADCWFVHAERHRDLQTATPDAVCGHNIDIWMPQGDSARAWRKLQNDVQMDWHDHPVNDARAEVGMNPVNSLWLWGGAASSEEIGAGSTDALFGFKGWTASFGACAASNQPNAVLGEVLDHPAPQRLLLLDGLIGPALAGDWSHWLELLQQLEVQWFAPLLGALEEGRIDRLSLIMNHGTRLLQWSATRNTLRKFWVKPALTQLLP